MFKKFCDYMYYLLTSPFKKIIKSKNQWYILFQVLGQRFDNSMELLYKAQEQSMIATCDDIMLQEHADDRGIKRYIGETDENYRTRIANYSEVLKLGGTDEGVILAVKNLGFDIVEIIKTKELKKDDTRWAEFHVVITIDPDKDIPIGYDILKKHVRKTKQTTALDNYQFIIKFDTKNNIDDIPRIIFKLSNKQENINKSRVVITCKSYTPVDSSLCLDIKNDLWKFDGTYKFDGSKTFDAWQSREEL